MDFFPITPSSMAKPAAAPFRRSQASKGSSSSGMEVIPGDYRIGGTLLAVATFLGPVCHLWWPQFFIHALLGGFLSFQALPYHPFSSSPARFRLRPSQLLPLCAVLMPQFKLPISRLHWR